MVLYISDYWIQYGADRNIKNAVNSHEEDQFDFANKSRINIEFDGTIIPHVSSLKKNI